MRIKFWKRQPSIRQLLMTALANQEKIMSGITDLQDAVAKIATDLTAEGVQIQAVINALQAGGLTDAQAEALAQQLQTSAANIEAATTSLQGALTPPAKP